MCNIPGEERECDTQRKNVAQRKGQEQEFRVEEWTCLFFCDQQYKQQDDSEDLQQPINSFVKV